MININSLEITFTNIENVKITSPNIGENVKYDVDLRLYTSRIPHNNYPYRPSYIHMLEREHRTID